MGWRNYPAMLTLMQITVLLAARATGKSHIWIDCSGMPLGHNLTSGHYSTPPSRIRVRRESSPLREGSCSAGQEQDQSTTTRRHGPPLERLAPKYMELHSRTPTTRLHGHSVQLVLPPTRALVASADTAARVGSRHDASRRAAGTAGSGIGVVRHPAAHQQASAPSTPT
jgi:hypothetical protein